MTKNAKDHTHHCKHFAGGGNGFWTCVGCAKIYTAEEVLELLELNKDVHKGFEK